MAAAIAPGAPDSVGADPERPALSIVQPQPLRAEWSELYGLFCGANDDERAVILRIARQVMSKGRSEYGPLHIGRDRRDLPKEALAEVADALFYVACALERTP